MKMSTTTPQTTKKRKINEETEEVKVGESSTPRRFLSVVSNLFKRSPPSKSTSLTVPTPHNTPAIARNNEGESEISNIKPKNLESTMNDKTDLYYQFGSSKKEPATKYFKPSPPPPSKRSKPTSTESKEEEKSTAMVPYSNSIVPTESSDFKSFSRFSTRTSNSNKLPLYRRQPLKLVDPSHIFRLLEKVEEDCPAISKKQQPVAVKRMKIAQVGQERWVPTPPFKNEDLPVDLKKTTSVRFSPDILFGEVEECEMCDMVKVCLDSHNNKKGAAKEKKKVKGGHAYVETDIKQPDSGGWGSNMFMANVWRCHVCLSQNQDALTVCASCETVREGCSVEKKTEAASSGTISSSGFSFGGSSADTNKASGAIGTSGFTFGSTKATDKPSSSSGFKLSAAPAKIEQKELPAFNFGAPTTTTAKTSQFTFGAQPKENEIKPSLSLFSFGAAPPTQESITILKSPTTDSTSKAPVFKFTSKSDKPESKTTFSFPSKSEDKNVTFAATPAVKHKKDEDKSTAIATPSTFGGSDMMTTPSTSKPEKQDTPFPKGFSFSAKLEKHDTPAPKGFLFGAKEEKKPDTPAPKGFSLGGKEEKKPDTPAPKGFLFGAKEEKAEDVSSAPSTGFSIDATAVKKTKSEPAGFSFAGAPTTAPKPAFAFGSQPIAEAPKEETEPVAEFGKKEEKPQKRGFDETKTEQPSFGFDQKTETAAPATSSTAFTFGAKTEPAPASSFTAPTNAPVPAFTFGAKAESTPSQPFSSNKSSFQTPQQPFGSTTSATQPFGSSSTSATTQPFGSSTSATSSGFTSASTNPFGATNAASNAPSTNPFGATNVAPASTSFGGSNAAPASAPFGASNTTSFGSNTAPPFGAAPSTNTPFQPSNFGAAQSAGFNPTSSFTQQAPQAFTAGGFNPSGATASGASGFNPSPSFGAAAPGFNAGGGFSIGAGGSKRTSQQGTKRRLIRARRPPGTT